MTSRPSDVNNSLVAALPGNRILYPAAGCIAVCALPIFSVGVPMHSVFDMVVHNDTYTHIPLIPLVSLFLIYTDRRRIFGEISHNWRAGVGVIFSGSALIVAARFNLWHLMLPNTLSLVLSGFVLVWLGAFLLFFGTRSFRRACFPLLFLLFTIPIPEPALTWLISQLQEGSAKAAAAIFSLFGIPYVQNDLVFSLPGVAIRVAEECSGIRSTLALLIMAVLASHLFLRTTWKQLLLCALVVPMSIAKNGLRIAALSALSIYVDAGFLHGRLHEYGGMVFFGTALIPLALLCSYFQRTDRKSVEPALVAAQRVQA